MRNAPINGASMYAQTPQRNMQQGGGMYAQIPQGNRQQGGGMYAQIPQGNRQQGGGMYAQIPQGNRQQGGGMYAQIPQQYRQQGNGMYAQIPQQGKQQGGKAGNDNNNNNNNQRNNNHGGNNSNNNNNRNKGFTNRSNANNNDDEPKIFDLKSSFNYAMFPKDDSQELIDYINSKIAQDDYYIQKASFQNPNYPYLRLIVPKQIERKLLDLTGTPLLGDNIYYFSSIPNKDEDKITMQIDSKFNTELLDDTRLNLSNISFRLGIPPLQKYTTSFILFLCAVESFLQRCEITEINFENNSQTKIEGFANILSLYPKLEKVYFAGNSLSNKDKFMYEPFNPPPDSDRERVVVETREFAKPNVLKTAWGNVSRQISKPFSLSLRPIIKTNTILSKRPKLALGRFIAASINPTDSEIHSFILEFVDCGWTDLKNIHKFYTDDSVFTLTADICPNNSPLHEHFIKNELSRDLLDNKKGKVTVGAREIARMQCDAFGDGFYAVLTSFNINILNDEMCAVVCHGAFQKNYDGSENVFCFDRSFFVGSDGEHIFITNDHIFIRKAKIIGTLIKC